MGFGFGKKKKSKPAEDTTLTDMQTTLDENGNVDCFQKFQNETDSEDFRGHHRNR